MNKMPQSVIVFICVITILSSCLEKNDSKNNIIYQTTDYEGIRNAILFFKSGGATAGDSYQVSIIPYQDRLTNSDTGNIFICDDPSRGLSSDTTMIKLRWLNYDTLKITYNKRFRIFKAKSKTTDAIIVYDSVSLSN